MQSKARFLGHPVHQMLVVLPLGALGLSVLFDLIALLSGNPVMAVVAFWLIAAGVASGLVAVGLALLLAALMTRAITRPINQAIQMARTVAAGDPCGAAGRW